MHLCMPRRCIPQPEEHCSGTESVVSTLPPVCAAIDSMRKPDGKAAANSRRNKSKRRAGSLEGWNAVLSIDTKGFSALVRRQGKLVEEQEKKTKVVEMRAKEVVARAQAARKEADAAETSAVNSLTDPRRK
jgi:hypothetical protein